MQVWHAAPYYPNQLVILQGAQTATLLPIIEEKVRPDSVAYTRAFHHRRINHTEVLADGLNHIGTPYAQYQ